MAGVPQQANSTSSTGKTAARGENGATATASHSLFPNSSPEGTSTKSEDAAAVQSKRRPNPPLPSIAVCV